MFIHLQDATIRVEAVSAIARSIIPATNYTPEYYTIIVYLVGCAQPLLHTYETEEERNSVFEELKGTLDEHSN